MATNGLPGAAAPQSTQAPSGTPVAAGWLVVEWEEDADHLVFVASPSTFDEAKVLCQEVQTGAGTPQLGRTRYALPFDYSAHAVAANLPEDLSTGDQAAINATQPA